MVEWGGGGSMRAVSNFDTILDDTINVEPIKPKQEIQFDIWTKEAQQKKTQEEKEK